MRVKSALDRIDQRILGDTFRRRVNAADSGTVAVVDENPPRVVTTEPLLAGDQTRDQLQAREAAARRRRGVGTVVRAVLRLVALVIALLGVIIVLGIIFENTPVNAANDIPSHLWPAARALTRPFHDLVTQDTATKTITVNWGIAAAVYFVVALVVRTLGRRRR